MLRNVSRFDMKLSHKLSSYLHYEVSIQKCSVFKTVRVKDEKDLL